MNKSKESVRVSDELIKRAYKKLHWYTFQCRDEEFDEKRVKELLILLDMIDPESPDISVPEEELVKFRQKYVMSAEEENPKETTAAPLKKTSKFRKTKIPYYAKYAAAVLIGIIFCASWWSLVDAGIETLIANQEKNFFEIEKDGNNGMKITVTGNDADRSYYNSWADVQAVSPDIMAPEYLPSGVELTELSRQVYDDVTLYSGIYTQSMFISVWDYTGVFDRDLHRDWELLDSVDGISFYSRNDRFRAVLETAHCVYIVDWTDLSEVKKIAYGLTGTLIQIP